MEKDKCKEIKTYTDEDGKRYHFDKWKFERKLNDKHRLINETEKKSMRQVKIELSKKLHVSEDAVKKWVAGVSGPVDLELVKQIADYFSCDYHELLSEKMEDKEMTKEMSFMEIATERQRIATRDRVRDIYEALVEAVDKVQEYFYPKVPSFYTKV